MYRRVMLDPHAATGAGAGSRHVRPRAQPEGSPASPPMSARCGFEAVRGRRNRRHVLACVEEPIFSTSNTGRWNRPKLAGNKPKPLTGQIAVVTGAPAPSRGHRTPVCKPGRPCGGSRPRWRGRCEGGVSAGNDAIGLAWRRHRPCFGGCRATGGRRSLWRARYPRLQLQCAAYQGAIGTLDDALLRKSFELNFFAHQTLAKAAVRIMLEQGTGGALLFNASKQAVNPGADFGAYGLPKAGDPCSCRASTRSNMAASAIRSNAVNADRIPLGAAQSGN